MSDHEINEMIQRIKNRRLELGYSYDDLANLTGITKSTLQRYETGYIKKVPVQQIQPLAKALRVTPAYLMGWEDKKQAESPELVTLGRLAQKANPEQLNDIIKYTKLVLNQREGEALDEDI